MNTLLQKTVFAAAALLLAGSAAADIGSTSVNDVHLAGSPADAFAYGAGWNPHAGPQGDTSGFGTTFDGYGTGSWSLLGKYDASSSSLSTGDLSFTFTQTTGTDGFWTVTNNSASSALTLDLVFALHAGNQGVGWLFDDQAILPGQTLNGDWTIQWTVGNNNANPDFSNLTLFGRDQVTTPVPEPETYGMLLAGLLAIGALKLRGKTSGKRASE